MRPAYVTEEFINDFIERSINEDIGDGDHSSISTLPEDLKGTAKLLMKDNGVIAGLELAKEIIERIDPELQITSHKEDGDKVLKGEVIFIIEGAARSILSAERTVLNCMQRMSGIATYTSHLCKLIKGTNAQLLDTRKTTPTIRPLEKWAVLLGGGTNHRFALYDMIMLKDNHIDFAGGISNALNAANDYLAKTGKKLKIEIETRNLAEVEEVLESGGADIVMLDNMDVATMREAVSMVDGRIKAEASGGITEETIAEVARTGVDYISIGALTHSVKSLDMSLIAEIGK